MIKLKDIIVESNNIELHKIITAKDQPAFMTEEQFNKKWASDIQESRWSEEYINKLEESMVLNTEVWGNMVSQIPESVLSASLTEAFLDDVPNKDNAWVKNQWMEMPHKGKFRKGILQFVMKLTPNSRTTHHLKKYFATGKISKQAASQVFRDYAQFIRKSLTGVSSVIWGAMYAAVPIAGWTFLLIPIIRAILFVATSLILPDLVPGGVVAQRHLTKRLAKGTKRIQQQARDSAKTKKEIAWINKRLKQAEKEAKQGGIFFAS